MIKQVQGDNNVAADQQVIVMLDFTCKSSLLRLKFLQRLNDVKYLYLMIKAMNNGYHRELIYHSMPNDMKIDPIMIKHLLSSKQYFHSGATAIKPEILNVDRKLVLESCTYMCSIGWFDCIENLELLKDCSKVMETSLFLSSVTVKYLKDRDFVMYILKHGIPCDPKLCNPYEKPFNKLSDFMNWESDMEIVKLVIDRYGYLPEKLRQDRELLLLYLKHHPYSIKTDNKILNDLTFVKQALHANGLIFHHLNHNLKQNRELVSIALDSDPNCIEFIPKIFRKDRELMLKAITNNIQALKRPMLSYLDQSLFKDKEIVLNVLKIDPSMISHVHPSLLSDKEILRMVASRDPVHYPKSPFTNYFRKDKEFMMEMLECGVSFESVDESIQDLEMVKRSIPYLRFVESFSFIRMELRKDRELTIMALNRNAQLFQYVFYEFKSDYEIAMLAVTEYGLNLAHVKSNLNQNFKIVIAAVKSNPYALRHVNPEMENYNQIVLETLKLNWRMFDLVENQEAFLPQILSSFPNVVQCLHDCNNKSYYLEYALQFDPSIIRHFHPTPSIGELERLLKKVPEILKYITYIPAQYYANDDLFEIVCKQTCLNVGYLGLRKLADRELLLKIYKDYSLSDILSI